jgi:uncharacterized membrane protein YwzB
MFHSKRIVATIIYLLTLIVTIIVAYTLGSKPGGTIAVLVMVGIQFCALTWYTLSYIPFGRDLVKNCIGGCFRG